MALDGATVGLEKELSCQFRALEIKGPAVRLTVTKPGAITRKGGVMAIKVAEAVC